VAFEYKRPKTEVKRWPWESFTDALATLTEQRFGVTRSQAAQHNAAAAKFKDSLPR